MAGFKTHIGVSTTLGVAYGVAGHFAWQMPVDRCMVAAGLCGIAGMLPDLDSDSGVPVRETIAFSAAIAPMLMLDRFETLGLSHEQMALAAGIIYMVVRFGVAEIFKRYTVHRGMWHSIPAALTVGLLGFLVCQCEDFGSRLFKSSALFLGFMSHLVVDEIWSIDSANLRLKKSSGTAMKFWGKKPWANFSTYAKLILVGALVIGDPLIMDHFGLTDPRVRTARQWFDDIIQKNNGAADGASDSAADGGPVIKR